MSQNNSQATSPVSSPAGMNDIPMQEVAHSPQSQTQQSTTSQPVLININQEATTANINLTAKENLLRLKNEFKVLYAHYLDCQKEGPRSDATKNAYEEYKLAEKTYIEARDAYVMFQQVDNPVNQDVKKDIVVPSNLPYLQLKTDTEIYKKNAEVFACFRSGEFDNIG